MNYEQRYKEALDEAKAIHKIIKKDLKPIIEQIFPELKESEDERIRKALIDGFTVMKESKNCGKTFSNYNIPVVDILAWLKKQEQSKKTSIWKHWKNGIAGNGEGKLTFLIKSGPTYSLSSCLSFECDYIELSELENLMLEKQAEQNSNIVWHDITEEPEEQCEIFCEWKGSTNTIWHDVAFYHADTKTFWNGEHQIEDVIKWAYIDEMIKEQSQSYFASKSVSQALQKETVNIANEIRPKFKVGDWIVNNYCKGKIVELTNDAYLLDTGQGIPFSCEHNIHLWTIKDAKDGDVLVCESG